ncbi:serine/threonine protein kinase [Streptomyces sp. bgisy100]|uniref:serine/threonine protein kinase n=1 Tax=Streptomyces sp. bgisy100 TaxID=3413783 RepID=UPI003D75551F
MAERSTAAVDVADSGDESLTAQAGEATADGVETQEKAGEDAENATTGAARNTSMSSVPDVEPPELHSGHKLARRYRLEECVTRLDGFSSWRAVDEKLRRAVGVHLLHADHPRARPVLAAARSAALLPDPRFVQVLDAVEEDDLVYVVHEWLPDATELTTVLASGPLEPHEAHQLVSQVSQAMTAAHREGLAHLRLTPSSVLRTESGQYRIRGLAVMAALRGISSQQPQRVDTEAIGALLYAALTQRWPYEENAYGLSGLPKGVGLIAPDQVRAGVHRGLAELAMRALANNGATPSRQEQPCTTPEELSKAVAALPRIRPPEPSFATPAYQPAGYRRSQYATPPGHNGPGVPAHAVAAPPPPLQTRSGKMLKWTVAALLIAALGLGSWQLADVLINRSDRTDESNGTPQRTGGGGSGKKKKVPGKPLEIANRTEFSSGRQPMVPAKVPNSADKDPGTAWVTKAFYGYPNFGNLPEYRQGSGIVVDLGSAKQVSGLDVDLYRSGQTVEVLAADEAATSASVLSDFPKRLTELEKAGDKLKTTLDKPVRTRYVLIHITELPPDKSPNEYRGGISEIEITG